MYYVYIYFDVDGTPCYVGKGKGNRWKSHFRKTRKHHSNNTQLRGLIRLAGGTLPVVILRDSLTNAKAIEIEMALIAAIGRIDINTGPLFNHTDGGEGNSGWKPSEGTRNKISASLTGRVGWPHTEESKRKISIGNKGKKRSLETGAKISAAKLGTKVSDATRAKLSAIRKGRLTPKTGDCTRGTKWWRATDGVPYRAIFPRNENDIAGRGRLPSRSEESRAKIALSLVGKKHSEERKANNSRAQIEAWRRRQVFNEGVTE